MYKKSWARILIEYCNPEKWHNIPTLAQCHYCEKDKLVDYYNFLLKEFNIQFGYTDLYAISIVEKYQIVRDRMLEENLMCSLLPSKAREYKRRYYEKMDT